MAGQSQVQSQKQIQITSLQQILVSELLELPAVELEQRFNAELEKNPALDDGHEEEQDSAPEGEVPDLEEEATETDAYDESYDYRTQDDIPDYQLRDHNYSEGTAFDDMPLAENLSFFDVLKEQLGMLSLTDEEQQVAEYLIGSLESDGLLRKSLSAIREELQIYRDIDIPEKDIEQLLVTLQGLDPAGIAARSLQECLLIQLRRKPRTQAIEWAETIVERYWNDFANNRKKRIMQVLAIDDAQYALLLAELTKLNPRPGSALGESEGKSRIQVIPDFMVTTDGEDELLLTLNNSHVPELHVSRQFTELLEVQQRNGKALTRQHRETLRYMKERMDAARGFIEAVKQRQRTMLAVMQAVIDMQRPFFLSGDTAQLKPMILKDVAERTGLDISTVSRVNMQKYVQTDFGIFPLKYFFSNGYVTDDGDELSAREIKRILKECIDQEDRTNPWTDEQLAEVLQQKGYPIARRTVAKYRILLNIPVARLRKV